MPVCGPANGNGRVEISWTAPTVSAFTPVWSYSIEVRQNTQSGSAWRTIPGITNTATSYTVPNLPVGPGGTVYYFKVVAHYNSTFGVGTNASPNAGAGVLPCGSVSACDFIPPNEGDPNGAFPVVGKPVTLRLRINSGVPPFTIRWVDSDGLEATVTDQRNPVPTPFIATYNRVYSTIGKKEVVVLLRDNNNVFSVCTMLDEYGPNVRVRPTFNER